MSNLTESQIKQTMEEGQALTISATPTTFVNARRVVELRQTQLDQAVTTNPQIGNHNIAYLTHDVSDVGGFIFGIEATHPAGAGWCDAVGIRWGELLCYVGIQVVG